MYIYVYLYAQNNSHILYVLAKCSFLYGHCFPVHTTNNSHSSFPQIKIIIMKSKAYALFFNIYNYKYLYYNTNFSTIFAFGNIWKNNSACQNKSFPIHCVCYKFYYLIFRKYIAKGTQKYTYIISYIIDIELCFIYNI